MDSDTPTKTNSSEIGALRAAFGVRVGAVLFALMRLGAIMRPFSLRA